MLSVALHCGDRWTGVASQELSLVKRHQRGLENREEL